MTTGSQKIDVFAVLEIEPTKDFKIVKKAYTSKAIKAHPDKHPKSEEEVKTREFQNLINAYELVDSEEKLERYFAAYQRNDFSSFFQKMPSNDSNDTSFAEQSGNGIYVPREGTINIFIPVPVVVSIINSYNEKTLYDFETHQRLVFDLQGPNTIHNNRDQDFAEHFDFALLAKVLNNCSEKYLLQIGMTDDEAVEIVNLHSQRNYTIIVEAKVSLTRLSDNRSSEKDMFGPNVLNAREGGYFWLVQNSTFKLEDIISVRAMTLSFDNFSKNEYHNTLRMGYQPKINEIWTEGTTILNKDASLQLTSSQNSTKHPLSIDQNSPDEINQNVLTSNMNVAINPGKNIFIATTKEDLNDRKIFNRGREKFAGFFNDKNEEWKKLGNEILHILDTKYNTSEKIPEGNLLLNKLNTAIDNPDGIKELFVYAEEQVQNHPSLAMKLCGIGLFLLGLSVAILGSLVLASSFTVMLSGVLALPGVTGIAVGGTGIGLGLSLMGGGVTLFGYGCQRGLSKKVDTFANLLEQEQAQII